MKEVLLGIDLGGTNIKVSVFDRTFEKLGESRCATGASEGWQAVLGRIDRCTRSLLEQLGIGMNQVAVAGMGIPGLLDRKTGISRFSPNFTDWQDVPVSRWFREAWGVPVFIDNDVRSNLYGEWKFGGGQGRENLVLLTLGTGLGSGIVMDGRVLYGATGSAGEVGHMNLYREGRPCRCGSSGCLGRYVSALGMLRTFREKLDSGRESMVSGWVKTPEEITARMISDAFDQNDPVAVETLTETGELLGFGLVNIINLFNPELILIGGGMAAAGERLLAPARKVIEEHALEISRNACELSVAKLGDSAGMVGAAWYGAQRLAQETVSSSTISANCSPSAPAVETAL